ncbi:ribonuclease HII [uncultured Bifidobacterium sp.]|uniref:ribonuclease HII n=1 Tax=uncultured Bifidobacterium sp. TaxID=165187 RepID=UPI0028DB3924|nr:ribonuclease HII [uncultured Bifidobacterium sp.]
MAARSDRTQGSSGIPDSDGVRGSDDAPLHPSLLVESQLARRGFDLVVGFDEVGRGALAGPVMVGAAALRTRDLPGLRIPEGLEDSKLLTAHRREALAGPLHDWCAAVAVGQADNHEIDDWGIQYALGVAALRALRALELELGLGAHAGLSVAGILDGPYDYITRARDSFDAPEVPVPAEIVTVVKGDRRCACVSAASVVAKVTRDRLMVSLAKGNPRYEPYGWASNKGYGSASHRAAIARLGPTPLHRVSWHLADGDWTEGRPRQRDPR